MKKSEVLENKREGVREFNSSAAALAVFVYRSYNYNFDQIRDIMHKILDDSLNSALRFNRDMYGEE